MTTDESGTRPPAGGDGGTASAPVPRRAASRKRLSTKDLPAWLSAGVAVVTLILTVGAGVIGLLSNRDEPGASVSAPPSAAAASVDPSEPVVVLAGFVPDPDRIIADGEFRNLVEGRDTVVLVGESKVDPDALSIFVEALLELPSPAPSGPLEGHWTASVDRPAGQPGDWRWTAGILKVPLGAGADEVWADIAEHGTESEYWDALSDSVDGP